MTRDFIRGGVVQNFCFSVITPNEKIYDMVQQMVQASRRIDPSQIILINGAHKGAKLQIEAAVHDEVVAFLPGSLWRRNWLLPIRRYRFM